MQKLLRKLWIKVLVVVGISFLSVNVTAFADPRDDAEIASMMRALRPKLNRPKYQTSRDTVTLDHDKYIPIKATKILGSAAQLKLISKPLPDEIEKLLASFWGSGLVQAMASNLDQVDVSVLRAPSPDEEWLKREVDLYEPEMLKIEHRSRPPINLVFLSAKGFDRLDTSEELVARTSRDTLAGIPVEDFCERKPGWSIPRDFSIKFLPWDLGSKVASSSRLDATLLDLVMRPDAFDDAANEDDTIDGEDSTRDELGDGEDPVSSKMIGWPELVKIYETKIKDGTLTLNTLVSETRKNKNANQSTRRFILAAAVSAPLLKKDCDRLRGVWKELTWSGDGWLDFFSCIGIDGAQIGPKLSMELDKDGDGDQVFSIIEQGFEVKAQLRQDENSVVVRYTIDHQVVGPETWFQQDGSVKAVLASASNRPIGYILDSNHVVAWGLNLMAMKTVAAISWYPSGDPQSFAALDSHGAVMGWGGFYQDGTNRYWLPIKDDVPSGVMYWWHKSGALAGTLNYGFGKKQGEGLLYYENGVEGYYGEYAEDKPTGRLVWQDPKRRPLFSIGYSDGKPQGNLEIRHDGHLIVEAKFDRGVVEGVVAIKNRKGLTVAEIPYKTGLLHGTVYLHDDVGQLRLQSNWKDGQADGETVVWYRHGGEASFCRFDRGRLLDWGSRRDKSQWRYQGHVDSYDDGKATINYYGGMTRPVVICKSSEWSIDQCTAIQATGQPVDSPGLPVLAARVVSALSLKFKPEHCGGATRTLDATPFLDHADGPMKIDYHVKELCRPASLATGMHCVVELRNSLWTVKSCVLSDDDDGVDEDDGS